VALRISKKPDKTGFLVGPDVDVRTFM